MFMKIKKARRNFVEPETDSKNRFQFFESAASCKNSYKDPRIRRYVHIMSTKHKPNGL